jgi:hypothetical protein
MPPIPAVEAPDTEPRFIMPRLIPVRFWASAGTADAPVPSITRATTKRLPVVFIVGSPQV